MMNRYEDEKEYDAPNAIQQEQTNLMKTKVRPFIEYPVDHIDYKQNGNMKTPYLARKVPAPLKVGGVVRSLSLLVQPATSVNSLSDIDEETSFHLGVEPMEIVEGTTSDGTFEDEQEFEDDDEPYATVWVSPIKEKPTSKSFTVYFEDRTSSQQKRERILFQQLNKRKKTNKMDLLRIRALIHNEADLQKQEFAIAINADVQSDIQYKNEDNEVNEEDMICIE